MRKYLLTLDSSYLTQGEDWEAGSFFNISKKGLMAVRGIFPFNGKLYTAEKVFKEVSGIGSNDGAFGYEWNSTSLSAMTVISIEDITYIATDKIVGDTTGNTLYIDVLYNGVKTSVTTSILNAPNTRIYGAVIGNRAVFSFGPRLFVLTRNGTSTEITYYHIFGQTGDATRNVCIGNFKEFFCLGLTDLFNLDEAEFTDFNDVMAKNPLSLSAPKTSGNFNYTLAVCDPTIPILQSLDTYYAGIDPVEDPLIEVSVETFPEYVRKGQVVLLSLGSSYPFSIKQWKDFLIVGTYDGLYIYSHAPEINGFVLNKFIPFKMTKQATLISGNPEQFLVVQGSNFLFLSTDLNYEIKVFRNEALDSQFAPISTSIRALSSTSYYNGYWIPALNAWNILNGTISLLITAERKLFNLWYYAFSSNLRASNSTGNLNAFIYSVNFATTGSAFILTMPFNMGNDGFKTIHKIIINGNPHAGAIPAYHVHLHTSANRIYTAENLEDQVISRWSSPSGVATFNVTGRVFAITVSFPDSNDSDSFIEDIKIIYSQVDKSARGGFDVNNINA